MEAKADPHSFPTFAPVDPRCDNFLIKDRSISLAAMQVLEVLFLGRPRGKAIYIQNTSCMKRSVKTT